jgi:hypothetical protein
MKKNFFPDGRLNAIHRIEENNLLADRLKEVKSTIDSSCPKTFSLFCKGYPKSLEKNIFCNSFS